MTEVIHSYFNNYDTTTAQRALLNKRPPAPLYTAPANITAIIKAATLDTILYGTCLVALYSITAVFMRKVVGITNAPSLSKKSLQAMLVLSPVFAYRLVQVIVGIFIHPATIPRVYSRSDYKQCHIMRKEYSASYQAMRISALSSTRHLVDGVLIKQAKTNLKGRWMIVTPPNLEMYENLMGPRMKIMKLASKLDANILFFNYPGVGQSPGCFPNRDAMVAAHRVMCSLVKEIGATQIIDFGWSIGGGVKWRDHIETSSAHYKYYSVDYQTFRSISTFGKELFGLLGSQAIKVLQWEYHSEEALKISNQPHTVIQCGHDGKVVHDNVISKDNALSQVVVEQKNVVLSKAQHGMPMEDHVIATIAKNVKSHFEAE